MVHDPQRGDKQTTKAGSLLFFIVAILVMAIGAMLEQLQHAPPLQIGNGALLLLLLLPLIWFAYRMRGKLQ
jgi:hypothetical protein